MGNEVKTYWDLTNKERAVLAEDEFAHYQDITLMQAGVSKPKPLSPKEVPDVEVGKKTTFYQIQFDGDYSYSKSNSNVIFQNSEDAHAAIDAGMFYTKNNYEADVNYAQACLNCDVVPVELNTRTQVDAVIKKLTERKRIINENNQSEKIYREMCKRNDEILSDLNDDYNDIKDYVRKYTGIRDTFNRFLELSDNDAQIAYRFLCKDDRLTSQIIKEAFEWFDIAIPEK